MFYRLVQKRSTIGLPDKYAQYLKLLGLGKCGRVLYQPVNPTVAARVAYVKELVGVELSQLLMTAEEVHDARRSKPGFQISK